MTDDFEPHLFSEPEHQLNLKIRKPRMAKDVDVPTEGQVILNRINDRGVICIHELKEIYPKLDVAMVEALCVLLHNQGLIKWFGGEWYGSLTVANDSWQISSAYRRRQAEIGNRALARQDP